MDASQALLGFVGLTGLHVMGIVSYRIFLVFSGQRKANSFPSGKEHEGNPLYQRLVRAHVNCLENLPLFASLVLLNKANKGPNIDSLAQIVLYGRLGQSLIHLWSTADIFVTIRAVFYFAQVAAMGAIGFKMLKQ